jgi:hypothetical protein
LTAIAGHGVAPPLGLKPDAAADAEDHTIAKALPALTTALAPSIDGVFALLRAERLSEAMAAQMTKLTPAINARPLLR